MDLRHLRDKTRSSEPQFQTLHNQIHIFLFSDLTYGHSVLLSSEEAPSAQLRMTFPDLSKFSGISFHPSYQHGILSKTNLKSETLIKYFLVPSTGNLTSQSTYAVSWPLKQQHHWVPSLWQALGIQQRIIIISITHCLATNLGLPVFVSYLPPADWWAWMEEDHPPCTVPRTYWTLPNWLTNGVMGWDVKQALKERLAKFTGSGFVVWAFF